jgi:hypothetical protein
MTFICKLCNDKEFETASGLWKHNNKHHKSNKINKDKLYYCSYCNKEYKHYQNKWTHEKKCKNIHNVSLIDKVQQLTDKIKELETKPRNTINNTTNNTNNTTNNIQIIINQPGSESIEHLSVNQQREIMQKGLNSLTYLIKLNNFNKETPENHSYCVTALNDKHASVINPDTNSVMKTDKNTLFDKILVSNIKNLEIISSNSEFSYNEINEYNEKLKTLKNLLFMNRKGLKSYYSELNLLSYNNKDLILDTWNTLTNLDKIIDSELESESDSESDSEPESDIVHYIEMKGKKYILEETNVFTILTNGLPGKLYGTYSDGKFKKI